MYDVQRDRLKGTVSFCQQHYTTKSHWKSRMESLVLRKPESCNSVSESMLPSHGPKSVTSTSIRSEPAEEVALKEDHVKGGMLSALSCTILPSKILRCASSLFWNLISTVPNCIFFAFVSAIRHLIADASWTWIQITVLKLKFDWRGLAPDISRMALHTDTYNCLIQSSKAVELP